MRRILTLCQCSRWPIQKRRRVLMTIVLMCVTMVVMVSVSRHQLAKMLKRKAEYYKSRSVTVKMVNPSQHQLVKMVQKNAENYEAFIPSRPSQIRLGVPPDIPRHFLIEEADACTRRGGDVEVVVFVHSAIKRVEQRRLTRLTWANSSVLNMTVVFMVGLSKNDQERDIVRRESELYHDIVQGDYGDHYHLLTYKALAALYWVNKHCSHVPWTLHADDDLLVDTHILQNFIAEFDNSTNRNNLHCILLKRWPVFRKGRYTVSQKEFLAKQYPPYCQGIFWLLPTKEVPRLLKASAKVNFLWVDDAYITGLLPKQSGMKISGIPVNRFSVVNSKDSDVGKKLAWVHLRHKNLMQLWSGILDHYHNTTGRRGQQHTRGTTLPLPSTSLATRRPEARRKEATGSHTSTFH